MKCEPELEPSTLIGQTIRWRNIIVGNSAGILLLFLSNQFQTRLQLRVQLKYKRRLFFLRANVKGDLGRLESHFRRNYVFITQFRTP